MLRKSYKPTYNVKGCERSLLYNHLLYEHLHLPLAPVIR